MIRAIIFDCFGVIITDALQAVREELAQINPEGAEAIKDIVAANNRGFMEPGESNERIATILGLSIGDFRRQIAEGEVRNDKLLAYILGLRGAYKTAMLSNIAGSSLARRFPDDELTSFFDVVVASSDIGFAKPEPEAYEITAERLGLRCEECVFIDDRELFCEGATSVGMHAVAYTNFAQLKRDLELLLAAHSS
jgi:HAD superfamily hydrolase (TIGR01509 family)